MCHLNALFFLIFFSAARLTAGGCCLTADDSNEINVMGGVTLF